MNLASLNQMVKENSIEFVDLKFCDINIFAINPKTIQSISIRQTKIYSPKNCEIFQYPTKEKIEI